MRQYNIKGLEEVHNNNLNWFARHGSFPWSLANYQPRFAGKAPAKTMLYGGGGKRISSCEIWSTWWRCALRVCYKCRSEKVACNFQLFIPFLKDEVPFPVTWTWWDDKDLLKICKTGAVTDDSSGRTIGKRPSEPKALCGFYGAF